MTSKLIIENYSMEKLHLSNNNIKEFGSIKTENVKNEFIKVKILKIKYWIT